MSQIHAVPVLERMLVLVWGSDLGYVAQLKHGTWEKRILGQEVRFFCINYKWPERKRNLSLVSF